jgi:hypothetical protein
MPTTPGAKQNEITRLQSEITSEISRDAPNIAQGVFGDNKNHPDMAQVSNQHLDDLYRQKYQQNDRAWLQAEARRDPQQFLDVAKRIGVQPPSAQAPSVQAPAPVMAPAMPPVAPAALPVAPPVALPPPAAVAPPPPAILGPNGLPLPPSGM